jgi:hypothetical protein
LRPKEGLESGILSAGVIKAEIGNRDWRLMQPHDIAARLLLIATLAPNLLNGVEGQLFWVVMGYSP